MGATAGPDELERKPLLSSDNTATRQAAQPPLSGQDVEAQRSSMYQSGPTRGPITYGTSSSPQTARGVPGTAKVADDAADAALIDGDPALRARLPFIFPAITIGCFLSAVDQTIIVSSYGQIGSELHALSSTSWIATAYLVTLTAFQPLYGKLSDIFGRKPCLLFCYLVFGLGCLFCGLARTIEELVAARAFAGIGGGGMTTVVSILLSDIVPLRERGTWQGYMNIAWAAGASLGPPMGGILVDSIGWRWVFLGQSPVCLVAFVAVAIVLEEPRKQQDHWMQKLLRVDFLGALVLICAVFTMLLALDRGSNVSWNDRATLVSLTISIPLFAFFIMVETKVATEPFAPGHVIFQKGLFACHACSFFSFAAYIAALFYVPLYFQAVNGLSATQAGILLIPCAISGVSGSLLAGIYMQRTGRYFWLTVLGYLSLMTGMTIVLLSSGVLASTKIGIIVGMCISASSNALGITTTLIGLIANASKEDQAVATACSYLFRSLGCVFGVSMSATIANQSLRNYLEEIFSDGDTAREVARRVRDSLGYIRKLEPDIRAQVEEAYAKSTRGAYGAQIGFTAGAAIAAWFIREKALSR